MCLISDKASKQQKVSFIKQTIFDTIFLLTRDEVLTMLEFFRRYQRLFFIVITSVVVISFSFFGTYQTFRSSPNEDKVAFTAVDGSKVLSSEFHDMIAFLSQDSVDTLNAAHAFAGNAFNDGVVASDILETGLGEIIARDYMPEIGHELEPKLERERRYTSYKHPKVPFLSAEAIWSYYAPAIKTNLTKLQGAQDAANRDAFKARVDLFLSERRFPQGYLKQFLRYQESQHKWLPQDTALAYQDLSLFGYHNTQDWFGRRFVERTAQFVINAAKMAESKGYTVSKEETLGSLFRNAENTYKQAHAQETMGIATPGEYFQQFSRNLGMDQNRLVKVWSQVLLFRRLFFENADSILVDTASYQQFYHDINEFVDIDLYQLPKSLQLHTTQDLEKCIAYLRAVSESGQPDSEYMHFSAPREFLTPAVVKKEYPELVEKSYQVKWSMVNKEQLETKIGVKATWQWQVDDANWATLQARYPELSKDEAAGTVEARLALLDRMDSSQRSVCDSFSRQQIVNAHPEWLMQALDDADVQELAVPLREAGGKIPFEGIQNSKELMQRFNETAEFEPVISLYSQDGIHFYRFEVVDKVAPEVVISFADAKNDGTLDAVIKEKKMTPSFEKILTKLDKEVEAAKGASPDFTNWDDLDHSRIAVYFLPYMNKALDQIRQKPDAEALWVTDSENAPNSYKLIKTRERLVKKDASFVVDSHLAFSQGLQSTSGILAYDKKTPLFFTVVEKGYLPADDMIRERVLAERELLGREVICNLGMLLEAEIKDKKAEIIQADDIQNELYAQK